MASERPETRLEHRPSASGDGHRLAGPKSYGRGQSPPHTSLGSLERAQIDALYRAMGPSNATSLIANGAIGPLLWFEGVSPVALVSFLLACGLIAGFRHLLYLKYLSNPAAQSSGRWGLWASVGGSIAGLSWSIPAFFMLPDVSPVIALLYTFVCCLMSVSSMSVSIGY